MRCGSVFLVCSARFQYSTKSIGFNEFREEPRHAPSRNALQCGRPARRRCDRMKFIAVSRITRLPDPITGKVKSTTDRLREVVDSAVEAEELGFDGYGVEERHERPFISSSPSVVLSHIAARTSAIRLFTAINALSLLDSVRAFEDYSTLDHLSGGRLEMIVGEGGGPVSAKPFSGGAEDRRDRNQEAYELFRTPWRGDAGTGPGKFP